MCKLIFGVCCGWKCRMYAEGKIIFYCNQHILKMLTNLLRLGHSVFVVGIVLQVIMGEKLNPVLLMGESIVHVLRILLEGKFRSIPSLCLLMVGGVLGWSLVEKKVRLYRWVYLLKGMEVHQALKAFRRSLPSWRSLKYFFFLLDFLRFTIAEYIYLGLIMMIYRACAASKAEPIPENHVVMYQLAVTASTIGYGDITPKSKEQMIFFTYMIPFICGSFVIYTNSLVEVYTATFLEEEQANPQSQPQPEKEKTQ